MHEVFGFTPRSNRPDRRFDTEKLERGKASANGKRYARQLRNARNDVESYCGKQHSLWDDE